MRAHARRPPARRTRLAARDQARWLPHPCPQTGERVQVWSRRGADFSYQFPGIAEAVRGLSADEALIDGEAVVLQIDGRSDFHALMTKRGGAEATLVAFDLLRVNGDDLRLRPLEARREALQRLVPNVRHGILFSEALAAEGAVVFKKACELGLGYRVEAGRRSIATAEAGTG